VFAAPLPLTPPLLIDNLNFFGRMRGFEALLSRVQKFKQVWVAEDGSGAPSLPVLRSLLLPIMLAFPMLTVAVKVFLAAQVGVHVHVHVLVVAVCGWW
jgi:hypothetical protein